MPGLNEQNDTDVIEDNDAWFRRVMFGDEPVTPPPAPAPQPNVQPPQDRRNDDLARAELLRRQAETQEKLKKLEEEISRAQQPSGDAQARASDIPDFTPEDDEALFGTDSRLRALTNKLVQARIHKSVSHLQKAHDEQRRAYEERIAALEKGIKEQGEQAQQTRAEQNIRMVMSDVTAQVPGVRDLWSHPEFNHYLDEQLLVPGGQATRRQLLEQAQVAGNSAYVVNEMNGFRTRVQGSVQTQDSQNLRHTDLGRAAQPTRSGGSPAGAPALAAIAPNAPRQPNWQEMERQYDILAARVRASQATPVEIERFQKLSSYLTTRNWQQ